MVGVHAVNELRHGAVMQWRRIEIDPHARDERQHDAHRQPEGVEDRQDVEHLVGPTEVDPGGGLRRICQHVAVGKDDAFGRALGAGGEQDRGPIVRLALHQRLAGAEERADLVAKADRRADILQVHDRDLGGELLDQRAEFAAFHEDARGDDRLQLGRLAGRQDIGRAGGEVDHRRHAPGRHQSVSASPPHRWRSAASRRSAFLRLQAASAWCRARGWRAGRRL